MQNFDFQENNKIKVFVANVCEQSQHFFDALINVLYHAGFEIITLPANLSVEQLKEKTIQALSDSHCSAHIIGDNYNYIPQLNASISEFQFFTALDYLQQNPSYRIFLWRPGSLGDLPTDEKQKQFWFKILNNINEHVIFTTYESPIMFVEDIRAIMIQEPKATYEVKESEIYLIYNEIDEESALVIKELLSEVANVEATSISFSSEVDYQEYIVEQIKRTILPVIYFKKASMWAIYFIKEIWRKIGGLSSGKTILFIGDSSVPENKDISFEAPNVITLIIPENLVSIEIMSMLEKIKNSVNEVSV